MKRNSQVDPTDNYLDVPILGAEKIGKELGLNPRQAHYALARRYIPAARIGRKYVTTRRRLQNHISGQQPAA